MVGVALEGGGSRGAYHMGAVRALLDAGYRFNGFVGTSIGAINSAMFAQGDFDRAYELWTSVKTIDLFDFEDEKIQKIFRERVTKETLHYLGAQIRIAIKNKGVDTERIRSFLSRYIDEERVRASKTDFGLVTVEMPSLKPHMLYKESIPQGELLNYIMASATFPGLKPPKINGRSFLDGGLYDNCPVNMLIEKGYHKIFAIRTLAVGICKKRIESEAEVLEISPSEDLGFIFKFEPEATVPNLRMGYFDTRRALEGLAGKLYYLTPVKQDSLAGVFFNLNQETTDKIGMLMNYDEKYDKRMIFEHFIPDIAARFKIDKNGNYEDIFIAATESLARKLGIDRFRKLTLSDLVGEVKEKIAEEMRETDIFREKGFKKGEANFEKALKVLISAVPETL